MAEGVDPTQMCQSLVDKVARSRQLSAIAEPELLVLFEDWLEELEEEATRIIEIHGFKDAGELARRLKVSLKGAHFLISKLEGAGKLERLRSGGSSRKSPTH